MEECFSEIKDWLLQNEKLHEVSGNSNEKDIC